MTDPMLRDFVHLVKSAPCPVTLVLSSAVVVGNAVSRDTFVEALRDFAKYAARPTLKDLATEPSNIGESEDELIHLLEPRIVSGGAHLDSSFKSPERPSYDPRRPPMRVQLAAVYAWHVGIGDTLAKKARTGSGVSRL